MSIFIDRFSLFRVISLTIAAFDFVQTIPGTLRLYRKNWHNRAISPVCFFYAMARYMSVISLTANCWGYFSPHFTVKSCKPFYMLPNVTCMLAGMAVQGLIFIRTYAISGRSKYALWGLSALLFVCLPLQVFGIFYHRDPLVQNGGCKGRVQTNHPNEPDWNIVYYSAHMVFDASACAISTFYIVYISRVNGQFRASRFLTKILRNGLLYTFAVVLVNLWVVLEFAGVFVSGAASALPIAVVMIAAAHLILSTQNLHSANYNTSEDDSRQRAGRQDDTTGIFFNDSIHGRGRDVELQQQSSSVFVLTQPYGYNASTSADAHKSKSQLGGENAGSQDTDKSDNTLKV
ncbi:putative Transmembrane protein [Mycena kentingensis (nom. inval.)]|nr:putative Transmembrane protein [Mycena kentingensis (nom. inval.)]